MVHRSNRCTVPLVSQWGKQDKKENDMSRKTKEAVQGVIYILPSFVLILIFCIIPIFMSGYFSFTEYNIMNSPKFVGLDNKIKMFKDS